MKPPAETCLFEEEQRLMRSWRWVLVAIIAFVVIVAFATGACRQVQTGKTWGEAAGESPIGLGVAQTR